MGIAVESTEWLLLQVEFEFGNVGFCGVRKTGVPREKPLEQRREPTTNSTYRYKNLQPTLVGGKCSHHYSWHSTPLIKI